MLAYVFVPMTRAEEESNNTKLSAAEEAKFNEYKTSLFLLHIKDNMKKRYGLTLSDKTIGLAMPLLSKTSESLSLEK